MEAGTLSGRSGPIAVVILHSSDDLYGADRVLLEVVKRLDPAKFRPIVVLPSDMEHVGLLSAELRRVGIEVHHLPIAIVRRRYLSSRGIFRLLGNLWSGSLAVRRLARANHAKVIYGFTFAVIAAPLAAAVSGLPLLMHAHEVLAKPKFVRRGLHKLFVSRSKRVVCISEAVRENILRDEPSATAKLKLVYNGLIGNGDAQPASRSKREEIGFRIDLPLMGMVGRVSHWKGQEIFLRAAALLRDSGVECQFVSIGSVFDGATEPLDSLLALRAQLGMEKDFVIEGFRSDARELVASFDALVLPSTLPEPFGMVILEAMAAGVPVVASAHGGPLEIVEDGKTGLLVPPSDPQALAKAMRFMLSDPEQRLRMGQAGKLRLEAEFSLKKQITAIENLLNEAWVGAI